MNKETIIGVLMLILVVELFINKWVYTIEELWDWINGGVVIILLVGAWQNLLRKS